MSSSFSDTNLEMEAYQISLLQQANPSQKLRLLAELNAIARMLALIGLRSLYNQESEAKIRRRLADLLQGEELARKVYADLDEVG